MRFFPSATSRVCSPEYNESYQPVIFVRRGVQFDSISIFWLRWVVEVLGGVSARATVLPHSAGIAEWVALECGISASGTHFIAARLLSSW